MTDNDTVTPIESPPKRRPGRPPGRRPKLKLFPRTPTERQPAPKPSGDDLFAGMTATICISACSEKGCVITGDVCGHPYKSGLQAKHYMQKDVMARYERAKTFLKHQAIDKRSA